MITRLTIIACCVAALSCGSDTPTTPRLASVAGAAEASVPDDFSTIQAALNQAQPGDVIHVAAGSYSEDLQLVDGVTVAGDPAGGTILFGSVTAIAVADVGIRDVSIDGALAAPGSVGVQVTDSSATVERVQVTGFSSGLVFRRTAADVIVGPSTVDRVFARGSTVAGMSVENLTGLTVTNSIFAYHPGHGLYGIFGAVAPTGMVFANNLFFANGYAQAGGAGVRMDETDGFDLANNIVVSNNVGLSCNAACPNDHSVVWGNQTNYGGAAVGGPANVQKDPRFTAPSESDFSLLFDSPAIDAADTAKAPDHDYAGTGRPLGDGADIGPFEFPASPSDITIAITEVMANPLNEQTGEYVELYNFGAAGIDVGGFVLDDGDATDVIAGWSGGTTLIPPGGYAVVLDPDYPNDDTYAIPAEALLLTVGATKTLGSGLSTSDPLKLRAADGVTPIDSYSFPANPGNGVSIEKDNLEDGDVTGNWIPSPCGRSPGQENCASLPPNVSKQVLIAINEIMANPLDEKTGEFVELFNFGPDPIELAGLILGDGDSFDTIAAYDGGPTVLQPGGYALMLDPDYAGQYVIGGDTLLLTCAATTTIGDGLANNDPVALYDATGLVVIDTYTHTLNAGDGRSVAKVAPNIGDIASNYTASTCASGSSPGATNCVTQDGVNPVSGDTIAIMEVMANAIDEDTGEYIELLNYGTEPIDLAGFRISDGDAEESLQAFELGGPTVLLPGAVALILDAEYALDYDIPDGTLLLRTPDTTIGSGLATNDPITLRGSSDAQVLDTWSGPFNPGNGISAEKIDLVVGDVEQNWIASPCKVSPGAVNCAAGGGAEPPPVSTLAIVISEVMSNPLNESTGEFVELFNSGPVGVDLAGYWLTDGDALDEIQGQGGGPTLLAPGAFAVILDPDYDGDYSIPGAALKLTVKNSNLGNGLTNSDPITLMEPDAVTVAGSFSFPYNAGNGRSVEKVTLTSGDVQDNWVTSSCQKSSGDKNDFASPGARNCADPYGGITGTQTLGQPCPFGAADCLSGLCATEQLTGNTFCTQDCADDAACPTGLGCQDTGDTNYPKVCVPVSGGALPNARINEVLYDNEGGDTATFVEIHGTPSTILDGIQLVGVNGSNGNEYNKLNLSGLIGDDGFFVIAHPSAPAELLAVADMTSSKVDFQNGPDSVQLRYSGVTLDAVAYGSFSAAQIAAGEGSPAAGATAGSSVARLVDGLDTDDNATDFVVLSTPTPGATNEAPPPPFNPPQGLLLSEVVVQPTTAEYVEIYNASDTPADLTHVYIADYADYFQITSGAGNPGNSDFRLRFPLGATLEAGAYAVVSLKPAADFEAAYGSAPDYDIDAMSGAKTASSGLSNGDEMLVLFTWDNASSFVYDLDYVVWGNTSDAMDKSAELLYFTETAPGDQDPAEAPNSDGEALSRCDADEGTEKPSSGNGLDGADETSEPLSLTWAVETPSPGAASACSDTDGPLDAAAVDFEMPDGKGTLAESALFLDAASFEAWFGVQPPAAVDFGTHGLAYVSVGEQPVPGHVVSIDGLALEGSTVVAAVDRQSPGNACVTLVWSRPAFALAAFPLPPVSPTAIGVDTTEVEIDCAATGEVEGEQCSETNLCGADLICAGLSIWDSGFCFPSWMTQVFAGPAGAIPDNDPAGLESVISVTGLATVEMDVIVDITIDHPKPDQLTVSVLNPYQPSGEQTVEVVLWDQQPHPGSPLLLSGPAIGFTGDESVNGDWRLRVVDHGAEKTGSLVSWTLELTSRYD